MITKLILSLSLGFSVAHLDIPREDIVMEIVQQNDKEKIKDALWFINAHRDGCVGSMVADHLEMKEADFIKLFRNMYNQELIYFANIQCDEVVTDEDLVDAMVMISGGYTHPDYKDIY